MLRKHQKEMSDIVSEIRSGADTTTDTVIVKACPGAGKSAIPIIASPLIQPGGIAKALCWICPRSALQVQGERNFIDPEFRAIFGHTVTVRTATNEYNPCRGHAGFITTYQAVGIDSMNTVLNDFKQKPYILVLDEFHHCEKDGVWAAAIDRLVKLAKFHIYMTGTLQRGDGSRIAFIDYGPDGKPALENDHTRLIKYTRSDALAEKAIIPIQFHLHDGHTEWIDEKGKTRTTRLSNAIKTDNAAAVYTALSTEYAYELLNLTIDHWRSHRKQFPGAKLLIVTANIQHAEAAVQYIRRMGIVSDIATSHESETAQRNIRRFKSTDLDVLVTIAMAYEGLSVDQISHIACLTHIRSTPWIEQMIGRAVRVDKRFPYETQTGFVFAPDDGFFRKTVARIKSEQDAAAKIRQEKEDDEKPGGQQLGLFGGGGGGNISKVTPIKSGMLNMRMLDLDPASIRMAQQAESETPSETESRLLSSIESHVRLYAFKNRYMPQKINAELKNHFGKPRNEMTIPELESVCRHLQASYPIDRHVRGCGKRVPTKAVQWHGYR